MSLSLISFNYKTTPIELREKLAISGDQVPILIQEIRESCEMDEVMVLSTCNRVEFYINDNDLGEGIARLFDWLKKKFQAEGSDLERAAVVLSHREALNHLFRVASSLESMVLGEPQVLGQVKEAYRYTVAHKAQGPMLSGLMPRVFRTAKRVRTETGIARFPVSISFVAVQLASKIFDSLKNKTVMVLGAGDMAELTVEHLLSAGIKRLTIANRTFTRAVALAERFQGSAVRFEELETYLPEADIVIASTGAKDFVITPEMARAAVKKRKGQPIFFIDIAVPRDVDPKVNELSNVYCYDIDDLHEVADANREEREREALKARSIVEEEIANYHNWLDIRAVAPTIRALRNYFTSTGEAELDALLGRLKGVSGEEANQIRQMVRRLLNKLLHTPSTRLKQMGDENNGKVFVDALSSLFDLDAHLMAEDTTGQSENPEAEAGNVVQLPVSGKSTS